MPDEQKDVPFVEDKIPPDNELIVEKEFIQAEFEPAQFLGVTDQ